jgi:thiamine biosynthesis lipoprotein ApbE
MKKIKKSILIGVLLIITVGCNNHDKIICTTSDAKTESMQITQNYTLYYLKNTVTKVESTKKYSFKDNENYKNFEKTMNYTVSNIKSLNNKSIIYSLEKTNSSYTIKVSADMTKISNEEVDALGFNQKLDEFRKKLEDQGLTCK